MKTEDEESLISRATSPIICRESTRIRTHLSPPTQATKETKVRVLFAFQRPRCSRQSAPRADTAERLRPTGSRGGVLYANSSDLSNFEISNEFR
jgi:hypothetical protein